MPRPAAPRPRRAARRARRGATLPTTLVVLTALAALAGGSYAMSAQTFRGGRNAMIEQRALAVAESGLNEQIVEWDRGQNAIAQAGGLAEDATVTTRVRVEHGDTAVVRVTRLDRMFFAVQSRGRAHIPNPQLQATRTVSALVRVAYPTINPQGAITTNGDVTINGAAFTADGTDRVPFAGDASKAWDKTRCAGLTGANTYALAVPPGAKVQAKESNFEGALDVTYTPAAGDPNTYIAFGTETMNTLIQNADLVYAPGDLPKKPLPVTTADGLACRIGKDTDNWGEPNGGPDAVAKCQSYFPIIYVKGTANIQGNGRGQGILIVDGDLQINGNFEWLGLVLVRDDMNKGNGSAVITGAVMARNVDMKDASIWGGSQSVNYSKCAVESALRGSAILIRVRDRAWAQLF